MILKLAALGALSYIGFRYFNSRKPAATGVGDIRLAGGPLSSAATVQHTADLPDG